MPILIDEVLIEPPPPSAQPSATPGQADRPPSPVDQLVDAQAAADRRQRLKVD
jgi:hypothetical protein